MKNLLAITSLILLGLFGGSVRSESCCGQAAVIAQEPKAKPDKEIPLQKHGRGRIQPTNAVSAARHAKSDKEHGFQIKRFRQATAPLYDCRTLGQTVTVQDQGACGDCYLFSGSEVCSCAQLTAGNVSITKTPAFQLSVQCLLDCQGGLGGCNGGDEWQVAAFIMASGLPSIAQYSGAGQNPGKCQSLAGMTLYQISSMGYCTVSAGPNSVANTQDIKNAMLAYGPISVAVAAGSNDWQNPPASGLLAGPNMRDADVDHAVLIIGWVDNASAGTLNLPQAAAGGYWIVQNQWSTQWAANGYAYIPYGAYSIGTEAFWVKSTAIAPPPDPTVFIPVITSATVAQVQAGENYSYQITASNNPTSFSASGLPAGVTMNSAGLVSGKPAIAGEFPVKLGATNSAGTGTATLALTVLAAPPPPPPSPTGATTLTLSASLPAGSYEILPAGAVNELDSIYKSFGDWNQKYRRIQVQKQSLYSPPVIQPDVRPGIVLEYAKGR